MHLGMSGSFRIEAAGGGSVDRSLSMITSSSTWIRARA